MFYRCALKELSLLHKLICIAYLLKYLTTKNAIEQRHPDLGKMLTVNRLDHYVRYFHMAKNTGIERSKNNPIELGKRISKNVP
jgi:hypothetical protein